MATYPIIPRKTNILYALLAHVEDFEYIPIHHGFVLSGKVMREFDNLPIGTEVVFYYCLSGLSLYYLEDGIEKERLYSFVFSFIREE